MSYTSITGMRSNRYPLMGSGDGLGCGCGCGGNGGCGPAVGQDNGNDNGTGIIGIAAVGATAIGLIWFVSRDAMRANRSRPRRRRRRTSRR